MLDTGTVEPLVAPSVVQDPLKFRDDRRYTDRLKDARTKTAQEDALSAARGRLDGVPVVLAVQSFDFMGLPAKGRSVAAFTQSDYQHRPGGPQAKTARSLRSHWQLAEVDVVPFEINL